MFRGGLEIASAVRQAGPGQMNFLGASSDLRIATNVGSLGFYRDAGPRLENQA